MNPRLWKAGINLSEKKCILLQFNICLNSYIRSSAGAKKLIKHEIFVTTCIGNYT